jgi:hypothetical protein
MEPVYLDYTILSADYENLCLDRYLYLSEPIIVNKTISYFIFNNKLYKIQSK